MSDNFDTINLVKLQTVENMINSKLNKLGEAARSKELREAEKNYSEAKEELDKIKEEYNDIESKRKKLEDAVELNNDRIKSINDKLFSGTIGTSKELLNYQEEIKSLKASNSKREDEIIELMMKLEDMEY